MIRLQGMSASLLLKDSRIKLFTVLFHAWRHRRRWRDLR
jgi:hypothetical protein